MVPLIQWVPWSLIKILGHPNIVITYSNKKCVGVSALQSLTSVSSSHLFKYSVVVMIYISLDILVGGLIGTKNLLPTFQIPEELIGVLGASHPLC
jgi:hypothetical protein